ncbi:hypothetical protein ACFXK0_28935 [Nocardia sp. NPDC059177]|uniref:DUF7336 domain-containing protein n=1 Tax=Nocardia sp. NPDC059177 TaxID=3346759 RepID=UPI0036C9A77A
MNSVFLLEHSYRDNSGGYEQKRIGVYASEEDARAAIARLITQPGFREYPDDFVIDRYVVDEDRWQDGYDVSDDSR